MTDVTQLWRPASEAFDIEAARAAFPALSQLAYFNFGARGVMAQAAIDAMTDAQNTLQSVGPGSRMGAAFLRRQEGGLRECLAARLGADPQELVFCSSISQGVSLAFAGLEWRRGDVLVIGEAEPPGSWLWGRALERRYGVTLRSVRRPYDGADFAQRLSENLCARTRMVLLSHVDWVTGAALDLPGTVTTLRSGIAQQAVIAIDGAQSAGARAVDLKGLDIDLYAVSAQKWFGGPDGLAACVLRGDRLFPSQIGWQAIDRNAPDALSLSSGAAGFGCGSLPVGLMPGWRSALECADRFAAPEQRFARIRRLTAHLRAGLSDLCQHYEMLQLLGDRSGAGILAVSLPQRDAEILLRALDAQGMVARLHSRPNSVRFCLHYMTRESEIDRLVAMTSDIFARGSLPGR